MRSLCLTVAFGLGAAVFNFYGAKADCFMEGHPICSLRCNGVCRAYYNPGPPESCQKQCRNFFVKPSTPGYTIKLEGVSEGEMNKIRAILDGK